MPSLSTPHKVGEYLTLDEYLSAEVAEGYALHSINTTVSDGNIYATVTTQRFRPERVEVDLDLTGPIRG